MKVIDTVGGGGGCERETSRTDNLIANIICLNISAVRLRTKTLGVRPQVN